MGGRFYFQQLSCSVFPLLFAMCKVSERRLVGLFLLQCCLSFTYLISDFAFSIAPHRLFPLLQFFELPADAINFERSAENFGIRRVQSLMVLAQGSFFILLVIRNLRDFFSVKGIWLIPLSLIILTVGTLSGHRWFSLIVGLTLLFSAYGQRFFDARNTLICSGVLALMLLLTYAFADRLPLASQRALSFLPGIRIEEQARGDASATLETRSFLRKIGYVWIGRGFGQSGYGDYSSQWDPTLLELHLNQGKFYNGIIGLLVNTGVPGTVFMLLFLSAGTVLALKIMRFLRTHGCDDNFERLCTVLAGLWMANVIAFLFLHGDSEYAMKTFSLQSGLLLACHRCLTERLKQQDMAVSV